MIEYVPFLGVWMPGPFEFVVILVVAVLIFGRRLPGIARSFGKSLIEFKKGIREAKETKGEISEDVKDEIVNDIKDAAELDDSDKN